MRHVSGPAAASVDVGALLDTARFTGLPLLVAVFTTLALIFDGFDIQAIAFAAPRLLIEWQIDRAHLAPVIAAGMVGMAIGALGFGALGDYNGRRYALIGSMVLVTIGAWLSSHAGSPAELAAYRLITGIGLGGTLPNAAALVAEFAPAAVRNVVLTVTVVGVPIGGMIGAALAADLIPAYGWRAIFAAGAVLPALLTLAMCIWLPESPRFLAVRPKRWPELARVLNALTRSDRHQAGGPFMIQEAAQSHVGVAALFTREFRYNTLIVWLIFFSNVFAVYAFFSWLPTVLSGAGLPLKTALQASLVFNLGGVVGAIAGALLMNRFGSRRTLIPLGVGAVLSNFAATLVPLSHPDAVPWLLSAVALAGLCVNSMQVGMYAVTAHLYPTPCRASGLGWALGMARFGGILSSFAGSVLVGPAGGAGGFFGGIAAVLVVTLSGVVLLRGHVPRSHLGTAKS